MRIVSGIWRSGMTGVLAAAVAVAAGCNRQPAAEETPPQPETPASAISPADLARLHQPFHDATVPEPPGDQRLPPLTTLTGKSVGKLYLEVTRMWDQVRFVTADNKRQTYLATIATDLGNIEITLQPDWAPNHVRSFVALAKCGYYDGLLFERVIHEQSADDPDQRVDLIEAGCPLGRGEEGCGSIGYWLKPEFNDGVCHDPGIVGACHGFHPDSAACRFYISLSKAPALDGAFTVFAKVTHGLDVAQKIFSQPVRNDVEYPEGDRPENPVVIRKVTVETKVIE